MEEEIIQPIDRELLKSELTPEKQLRMTNKSLSLIHILSNRYNIQNDIIELDKLQKELQDTKYKALSTSSQITEKSREKMCIRDRSFISLPYIGHIPPPVST